LQIFFSFSITYIFMSSLGNGLVKKIGTNG
jgi:hypothetical protein